MTVFAATDSCLVNSRAPAPLYQCRHCRECYVTNARAHHLVKRHIVRAIVVQWKQSSLDDEFTLVRS